VKRQLATGEYDSEDGVLLHAMRSLQRGKDDLAAIQAGIEDMEAGHVTPLRDFDREFRAKKNIPQDA